MAKVSVTGGLAAAVKFVPKGIGRAWLALLLTAAATTFATVAERGDAGLPGWSERPLSLVATILGVMLSAALYRLALTDGPDRSRLNDLGPGGFQWSGTEWILLAANILVGLLQILVVLVVVVAFGVVAAIAAKSGLEQLGAEVDVLMDRLASPDWLAAVQSASQGAALVLGATVLLAVLIVILLVRFSLFAAATVAENRIVVTSAWRLSAGSTWPLLIGLALAWIPTVAFVVLAEMYAPDLSAAAQFGVRLDPVWVNAAIEAAAAMLQVLVLTGFLAHAYRRVAPKRSAPMHLGGL